jgi:hypothetical protein
MMDLHILNLGAVTIPLPRYTFAQAESAADEWGANCGPNALAVMTGRSLDEVHPHLPKFDERRYTNPSMMFAALKSLGIRYSCGASAQSSENQGMLAWPSFGLARIQWEGPWTKPGVPIAARYRHTHWVGAMLYNGDQGVFDVNCLNNGSGWVLVDEWASVVVPWLLSHTEPKASGKWHITHSVELLDVGVARYADRPQAKGCALHNPRPAR